MILLAGRQMAEDIGINIMTMNIGTVGGKLIAAGIVLLLLSSIGFTVWALLGS